MNSRNANKIFHSKYQILSMISTTFKEMYAGVDFTQFSDTWQERRQKIARNLVQYYVYDIITNYWSEGGTGKIHSAAKPNRYMIEIPSRAWMVALDGFFERSMLRAEKKNIANPRSEEYVILNCIYLKTLSYLIYMNGMSGGQFGFQSANAFVFFVIVVIISFLQMKFLGKKEEQL